MPVDLIQSDASLQRLLRDPDSLAVINLFKSSKDKLLAKRVLSLFEQFEIKLKYLDHIGNGPIYYSFSQIDFFRWCDLIALLIIQRDYIGEDPITKADIFPCRIRLVATRRGTLELNRLMAIHGINDDNCHIHNEAEEIWFKTDAAQSVIRITNVVMEHAEC